MASLAPNFNSSSSGQATACGLDLCQPHDHLCLIYDTREEQLAAAVPFLRIGLERGEKCIYVVDESAPAAIREAMRADGTDVEAVIESGALTILTQEEAYLKKDGAFDPDWMMEFLRREIERAEAQGYKSFRVTGELTWALRPAQSLDTLVDYECRLNDFFQKRNMLAICQYNRRRFNPETLLHILRSHPLVVHGGLVCDNPFYIPPETFRREEHDAGARVERLLSHIVQNAQLKQRLAEESEQALRLAAESDHWRHLYEAVLTNTPDFGYMFDLDHRFTYANDALLAVWGKTWDEAIGKNCLELGYEPWQAARHEREIDEVIATRKPFHGEVPFAGVNSRLICDYIFFPIFGSDGEVEAVGGVTRDVTQRKRAESLLREQQRLLELIATGSSLDECLLELTASVALLRPGARAAVLVADASGTAMARALSVDLPASFDQGIRGAPICELAIGTCGTAIFESKAITCADIAGDTRWSKPWRDLCVAHGVLACHSTPVFDSGGKAVATLFLCFGEVHELEEWDRGVGQFGAHIAGIVVQRESARERQQLADAALRKSEKLAAAGRMAATVAHEINNPLEAIVNLCYLLRSEELSPSARELLDTLRVELDRVTHITRQTLAFYREGKSAGPLDLAGPIQAAVTLFARKAERQGASIRTRMRTSATVFGFSGELRQVFANLLSNALEAGSTAINIRVFPSRSRCGVCVLVSDNGSGISAESAHKLFQPFFTTKEEKGTGLGLWVSKGIMQKHEGSIRVRTSVAASRHGTTFRLFFPTLAPGPSPRQRAE